MEEYERKTGEDERERRNRRVRRKDRRKSKTR